MRQAADNTLVTCCLYRHPGDLSCPG